MSYISIIIPAYNEELKIKDTLESIKNIKEIAQELIHTREKLAITEEMLDEEIKKNEDYEEILNDIFEN